MHFMTKFQEIYNKTNRWTTVGAQAFEKFVLNKNM